MDWLGNVDLDNGLSPGRRQAVAKTSADVLIAGPLETHFSEIWIFYLKNTPHQKSVSKIVHFFVQALIRLPTVSRKMNQHFNHNLHAKPTADVKDD